MEATKKKVTVKAVLWTFVAFSVFLLFGCASTQIGMEDVAKKAAFLAARPVFEKIFFAEAPIAPSARELYSTVKKLPGKPFDPSQYFGNLLNLSNGVLRLSPGDYVVPVMTYCMQSSGSSPAAHQYGLGKLSGKRASAIHDLNARGLSQFTPEDIQVLSWSIQNGILYEEMSAKSKEIINKIIPEHKEDLKLSFYQSLIDKWNVVAKNTGLPHFEELTDEALSSLGSFGESVKAIQGFRKKISEHGYEYENLSSLISLPGPSSEREITSWSQISENVYARFLTSGHYLNIGELQIRVVGRSRVPQVIKDNLSIVDVSALIADPGMAQIQPLSFSALSGVLAIGVLPVEASPLLAAAVIAAILTEKAIDWNAFSQAVERFGHSANQAI